MKRGKKIRLGLDRRVHVWNQIVATGGTRGTNTKMVRRDDGKCYVAYHKPGSRSGRKGYGKIKKVTR